MNLVKTLWTSALTLPLLLLPAFVSAQQPDFPELAITLAPVTGNKGVDEIAMTVTFDSDTVKAGEPLLDMPIELVSTPSANLKANDLTATDSQGNIRLSDRDAEPNSSGQFREFITSRDTQGTITLTYSFSPRAVDETTRNGPLFDFRKQDGGVMGAGVYFMVLPKTKTPYNITVNWDLDGMPDNAKGVWSYGEGEQHQVGPAEMVRFSYYAAGTLKQFPEPESQYTQYWLNDAPFNMKALASQTRKLFEYMANFFGDTRAFKVFGRANPYPAGGGTGLGPSFMFGYGKNGETTDAGTQALLAHELSHTWPRLNGDEPHALTAWYTEGTAEFYSLVMLKRTEAIDIDEFVHQLNMRMDNYYGGRYNTLTNQEAGDLFWKEHEAQRVPYGRGLSYLLKVDQQLKDATNGETSVDTLVLDIYHRQLSGEVITLATWKNMLNTYLGPEGVAAFIAMSEGKLIKPEPRIFGCLVAKPHRFSPFELGFDPMRLGEVSQLREDSQAARAGLKEGDSILSITSIETLKNDPTRNVDMTVKRGDKVWDVSFQPRRDEVSGWHWERDTHSSHRQCEI